MTFDGWNTQLYAVGLSYGQDSLMHFRTKGSKNGVRRYQEADGTWTPLGLKERRAREGFGERRAARKEARAQRRAARAAERSANIERARQYKQAQAEARRKRNPKNLTDDELKKGIERLKMEQEYRELSRSPAIKTAEGLVNSYLKTRAAKTSAEAERRKILIQDKQASAQLLKAKAELQNSKNDLIKDLNGTNRRKASEGYLRAKTERSKQTIKGAIGSTISNLIRKEGNNLVKEWGDESIGSRASKHTKSAISRGKKFASRMWANHLYGRAMRSGSGPDLN